MRLVLVGYRGCGKTSVGRHLASQAGVAFIDLDQVIEAALGMSIGDWFISRGESAFRDEEAIALRQALSQTGDVVISTGGGCVLRPGNRALLQAFSGIVAYLEVAAPVLQQRLRHDPARRPDLTSFGVIDEVPILLGQRDPLYREVAHLVIDGTMPVQLVTRMLIDAAGAPGHGGNPARNRIQPG